MAEMSLIDNIVGVFGACVAGTCNFTPSQSPGWHCGPRGYGAGNYIQTEFEHAYSSPTGFAVEIGCTYRFPVKERKHHGR